MTPKDRINNGDESEKGELKMNTALKDCKEVFDYKNYGYDINNEVMDDIAKIEWQQSEDIYLEIPHDENDKEDSLTHSHEVGLEDKMTFVNEATMELGNLNLALERIESLGDELVTIDNIIEVSET